MIDINHRLYILMLFMCMEKADQILFLIVPDQNIDSLTREMIVELIEMIYVHEGGTITVEFKYQDEYQRLLDLMQEAEDSKKAG